MIEQLWNAATQIKNSTLPHDTKVYLLGFMLNVASDTSTMIRLHNAYSTNNSWPNNRTNP